MLQEPASDTNYQSIDPDLNINSDSSDERYLCELRDYSPFIYSFLNFI